MRRLVMYIVVGNVCSVRPPYPAAKDSANLKVNVRRGFILKDYGRPCLGRQGLLLHPVPWPFAAVSFTATFQMWMRPSEADGFIWGTHPHLSLVSKTT